MTEDWTTDIKRYTGMNAGPPVDYSKEFVTEDSGEREEYLTGMKRDTQKGKPRFDLVIPLLPPMEETMFYRWAALMTRGAEKYEPRNWELAETQDEYHRFRASAIRHFFQWWFGVENGEDHAAAVFFNIQGAEYVKWRMEQ